MDVSSTQRMNYNTCTFVYLQGYNNTITARWKEGGKKQFNVSIAFWSMQRAAPCQPIICHLFSYSRVRERIRPAVNHLSESRWVEVRRGPVNALWDLDIQYIRSAEHCMFSSGFSSLGFCQNMKWNWHESEVNFFNPPQLLKYKGLFDLHFSYLKKKTINQANQMLRQCDVEFGFTQLCKPLYYSLIQAHLNFCCLIFIHQILLALFFFPYPAFTTVNKRLQSLLFMLHSPPIIPTNQRACGPAQGRTSNPRSTSCCSKAYFSPRMVTI